AIGPDDTDDPAPRQIEAEVVDQQAIAVALDQTSGLDHEVAQTGAGRDDDLGRGLALAPPLGEQLLVSSQTRLRLRLARAWRHPDPLQLALERPLARSILLFLLREALALLVEPGGIVPLPGNPGPAVQLEDPAGHVVEKVPIVGDRDDG